MFGKRAAYPDAPASRAPDAGPAPDSGSAQVRQPIAREETRPAPRPKAETAQQQPPADRMARAAGRPDRRQSAPQPAAPARRPEANERTDAYYEVKTTIFNALIDTIDLGTLAQLDQKSAAEEIRDIVTEIISIKNVVMSVAEQEQPP